MRRRIVRPYGHSTSVMRLVSMLMALAVLWALFQRLKDPTTWQMLADDRAPAAQAVAAPDEEELAQIVPGPNDLDEAEVAEVQKLFEMVTDKTPLKQREMDAYWRLLQWSRTEPFVQLKQRAKDDVPFTQFWDQPEKYRGQPITLRLHVRRVLEYDAKDNPLGVAKAYEAWGWTDESRSFPYVVVFPDAPLGLPIGTDVRVELEFVGYFLKVMSYTAFDNPRGAPLLMGRVRLVSKPLSAAPSSIDVWTAVLVVIGIITIAGFAVWLGMGFRKRAKPKLSMLPSELSSLTIAEGSTAESPFDQLGKTQE